MVTAAVDIPRAGFFREKTLKRAQGGEEGRDTTEDKLMRETSSGTARA